MAQDTSDGTGGEPLRCPACNVVLFKHPAEHPAEVKSGGAHVVCKGCGAIFDLEGLQCEVPELDPLEPDASAHIRKMLE